VSERSRARTGFGGTRFYGLLNSPKGIAQRIVFLDLSQFWIDLLSPCVGGQHHNIARLDRERIRLKLLNVRGGRWCATAPSRDAKQQHVRHIALGKDAAASYRRGDFGILRHT
jgi:hypothetical protein